MTSTKPHSYALGNLMCTVTEQVLWHPVSHSVRGKLPGSSLACRVGSGQATYHRFDPRITQHQITYGVRMIDAKQRPDTAAGWLSGREIRKRGYFKGELSPLNLLAHTCCHEFAHLVQHCAGQRLRGSVHNRYFYNILDELHENGEANAVRNALLQQASEDNILLSATPFEFPELHHQKARWQIGEAVSFEASQRELFGEIVRVNRNTCTVDGVGKSRGVRYRVPLQMLRRTS
ncbi:MAG TPA: hypothetical protein VL091_09135 [Marinobacter sp.]|nr:hypothetical protein [Marinobacter sp.]